MNTSGLAGLLLLALLFSSSPASAKDIGIAEVYSNIHSADVTIHADIPYSNLSLDAALYRDGEVLETRHLVIGEILPGSDLTKIIKWNLPSPDRSNYRVQVTLSSGGSRIDTGSYNFSYGWIGVQWIVISAILPDSRGVSVLLKPQFSQEPVLADIEYMLVDGDTVVKKLTDRRMTISSVSAFSKEWNVIMLKNHPYSVRVRVRLPDTIVAGSADFVAADSVDITELYRDANGASVTLAGTSRVPFNGSVRFTVSKGGRVVEDVTKKSPVLMAGDDETIEVMWGSRLPPGVYELSVEVLSSDGSRLDRWDTLLEAEERAAYNRSATPTAAVPGPDILIAIISVLFIAAILSIPRSGR